MSDEEKKEAPKADDTPAEQPAPEEVKNETPAEEPKNEEPSAEEKENVSKEAPATEQTPAAETPSEEVPGETKPEGEDGEESQPETPGEDGEESKPETPTETAPTVPAYKTKLTNLDELKPGMTVRVHEKIKDVNPRGEERERIQVFEGIILGLRGSGDSRTMTVRKVSGGIGVEKIYPINSPVIDKIELVKQAKVRQAKLGYLKNLKRRFKRKLKETHVGK